MNLKQLHEIENLNELDLLYKIIDISSSIKRRTEQSLKGNKKAGLEVRSAMQDIRLLAEQIRYKTQKRKGIDSKTVNYKGYVIENSPLNKAIVDEKESLIKEDLKIKLLEEQRKQKKL